MMMDRISVIARDVARGSIPRDELEALLDQEGRDSFRRADGRIDSVRVRRFVQGEVRAYRDEQRRQAYMEREVKAAQRAPLDAAVRDRLERLGVPQPEHIGGGS